MKFPGLGLCGCAECGLQVEKERAQKSKEAFQENEKKSNQSPEFYQSEAR